MTTETVAVPSNEYFPWHRLLNGMINGRSAVEYDERPDSLYCKILFAILQMNGGLSNGAVR